MVNIYAESRDTLNISQDRRDFDWTGIHMRRVNQNPLALLLSKLGHEPASDPKYNHFEDQLLADTLTVNGALPLGSETTITFDDVTSVVVGVVLHIPRTGENMYVSAISYSLNQATVTRNYGGSGVGSAINDNEEVFNIGTTFEEGATIANPVSTVVETKYNYTQIFKKSINFTGTELACTLRGGNDESYQTRKAEEEFARDMEYDFFYGKRNLTTGTNGKPMRQTGGLLQWITTNVTDVGGVTLDEETFEGWVKDVFENGDTDERLCLCSPLLMQAISGWAKNKLQMRQDETTYGMRIYTYVTPFGTLNLLMHRLLKGNTYGSFGIILDMNNIKYKALRNVILRRHVEDRKDDEVTHEIRGEVGIKVIDETSHGILKNFTL